MKRLCLAIALAFIRFAMATTAMASLHVTPPLLAPGPHGPK